jgi:hypothetical protein
MWYAINSFVACEGRREIQSTASSKGAKIVNEGGSIAAAPASRCRNSAAVLKRQYRSAAKMLAMS